jgi:hypothetical protein
MYEKDNVFYAGNPPQTPKLIYIKPLENFKLHLLFSNGEYRIFDCKDLFQYKIYEPLKDKEIFNKVYLTHGVPAWLDDTIDIAPEIIYDDSIIDAAT